ncbi:MAG: hypothetical protein ABSD92_12015 [Candidatus Bathyarchaeia archaeon]
MGIDFTTIKVAGKDRYLLLVIDISKNDHDYIAYALCEHKDACTVKQVLYKLKEIGYDARIVISDLDDAILSGVKEVYPSALSQGCLWHLGHGLERDLPTRRKSKQEKFYKLIKELIDSVSSTGNKDDKLESLLKELGVKCKSLSKRAKKRAIRDELKNLIVLMCVAKTEEERAVFENRIKELKPRLDKRAKQVLDNVMGNLEHYHVLSDRVLAVALQEAGTTILFNNFCENGMGLIKRLKRDMRGFHSWDSAVNLTNARFYYLREGGRTTHVQVVEEKETISEIDRFCIFSMPFNFYLEDVNSLSFLSNVAGVSKEKLKRKARQLNRVVEGDYIYTNTKLAEIYNLAPIEMGKALLKIMSKTKCQYRELLEPLKDIGIRMYKSKFDPTKLNYEPLNNKDESNSNSLIIAKGIKANIKEALGKCVKDNIFDYKDGLLVERRGFWAIVIDQDSASVQKLLRASGYGTTIDPPLEVPLNALLRYKLANLFAEFSFGENFYHSGDFLEILRIIGNENLKLYVAPDKDQPLVIESERFIAIQCPRVFSISDIVSEIKKSEKARTEILTLQRIVLNSRNSVKINVPPFSLSGYAAFKKREKEFSQT